MDVGSVMKMYRGCLVVAAALVALAQSGCIFLVDGSDDDDDDFFFEPAAPSFALSSLEILNPPEDGALNPGDTLSLQIGAVDVRRAAEVEVNLMARSTEGVIEDLDSALIQMPLSGQARYDWDVNFGQLAPGEYEIVAQVSFGAQSLESERLDGVWAPRLDDLKLTSIEPGQRAEPGQEVTFEVKGQGVAGHALAVDVIATSLTLDTATTIDRILVFFDNTPAGQRAQGAWTVRGTFLDKVDTHEISFAMAVGDQRVDSEPFIVDVPFILGPVAVNILKDGQERAIGGDEQVDVRFVDAIVASVSGEGIDGRSLTWRASPEGFSAVESASIAEGGRARFVFEPPRDFGPSPLYSLRFEVGLEGVSKTSRAITMRRWGYLRCAWLYQNGSDVRAGESFRSPVNILLRVETWGVPDRSIRMEIFEEDPGANDTTARLDADLVAGVATASTSLRHVSDGFGEEAEYRFKVQIGEGGCQSPLVNVVRSP